MFPQVSLNHQISSNYSNNSLPAHSILHVQSDSLSRRLQSAFKSCEHAWSYIGKSLLATRHFMNATVRSARILAIGCRGTKRMQRAVTNLKLFAIVSVPFALASIPSQIAKIGKRLHLKDGEGVLLSSLSMGLIAADTFDSLTTFAGAVLQTLSRTSPHWLSAVSMPTSVAIVTMGSISRTMHLIRLGGFYSELDRNLIQKMSSRELSAEELQQLLKSYLESKIGIEGTTPQAAFQVQRLEAIAERQSNTKVLAMLKELKTYIQPDHSLGGEDIQRITKVIQDVESALSKEIGTQRAYLFTNMLNGMALTLFLLAIVPPVPFILLGISMCLRVLLLSEIISFGQNTK